eukprot:8488027-Lingulodinium_polyedra.AAC.1
MALERCPLPLNNSRKIWGCRVRPGPRSRCFTCQRNATRRAADAGCRAEPERPAWPPPAACLPTARAVG